jgi:CopG-like RHH_1 or ribbon-helix-helix domain, RHH_5
VATATKRDGEHVVLQAYVPRDLADELKRLADAERRSVSNTIRLAVEERLSATPSGRP